MCAPWAKSGEQAETGVQTVAIVYGTSLLYSTSAKIGGSLYVQCRGTWPVSFADTYHDLRTALCHRTCPSC